MNHFVFENLARGVIAIIARHAANQVFRREQTPVIKSLNEKRNTEFYFALSHVYIARRPRELA
jgi:hypothetical protein